MYWQVQPDAVLQFLKQLLPSAFRLLSKRLLRLPRLHLFDHKYSKNSHFTAIRCDSPQITVRLDIFVSVCILEGPSKLHNHTHGVTIETHVKVHMHETTGALLS